MKPYFKIALIILSLSVIGALLVATDLALLFLFAELATLVSFYMFFSVIIPSLFPEYHRVEENFNCGASEMYLHSEEAYAPNAPFGGMKNK